MYKEMTISLHPEYSAERIFKIELVKSFEWMFHVLLEKKGDKYEVTSSVEVDECSSSFLSKKKSVFKIRFLSHKMEVADVERSLKWRKSREKCEFEQFEVDAASFVERRRFHVKISVTINDLPGNYVPFIDFSQPTNHSDVVLVVNGHRLHVNKAYLAMYSKYFDTLFFSNFKEATQEEIVLEGLDYHQFHNLLQQLYPGSRKIDDRNWEYLLELADRFDVPQVFQDCEQYLLTAEDFEPAELFIYADKYNMIELYEFISKKLTMNDLRYIKRMLSYKELTSKSKDFLLKKAVNL